MPRSGVSFDPILERILVAQWANYTQEGFEALDGSRQSVIVAAYRTHHQMEAVLAKMQSDKMNRGGKKG